MTIMDDNGYWEGLPQVKVRKEHKCTYCERTIKKGELAGFISGRLPRYDEDENQIGIEYFKIYECNNSEQCVKEQDRQRELKYKEKYASPLNEDMPF
jgi:hypothetical protein